MNDNSPEDASAYYYQAYEYNFPLDLELNSWGPFRELVSGLFVGTVFPVPQFITEVTSPQSNLREARTFLAHYFEAGEEDDMTQIIDLVLAINNFIEAHDHVTLPIMLCEHRGEYVRVFRRYERTTNRLLIISKSSFLS